MRNVKEIVTAALALTLICSVVVAALAGTNLLTKDTIAAQELEATNAACAQVLSTATAFELLDGTWAEGVLEVYKAVNGDTLCGYVIKTSTVGKSSGLVVMTGVTPDGTVSGVTVVSDNETAGYVDNVVAGGLLDRLMGVTVDGTDVDGVSMATKSSNGIKNGVRLALQTAQEVSANG